MFRKFLLTVLIMTFLAALGVAIGCGKASIPGKYANEDNPSEYLELNEDGTFYLKESGPLP